MTRQTHEVFNQFDELCGYNVFSSDPALVCVVQASGASWASDDLDRYGAAIGNRQSFIEAEQANRHVPELARFDARGRRIDHVEFHPSWHALMARFRNAGWISLPFRDQRAGRWVADMAALYLHSQVESGTTCPSTMTWASIAVLQREPQLWASIGAQLLSAEYDARDLPMAQKRSIYIGMGMTEKQGGSDVRANRTEAVAVAAGGRGGEYRIRGHKWFFSAPMCDAHLVVAQLADAGPSCFFVPRWQPDGERNAVLIQRLKDKLGNRSNSSGEVEFDDAHGLLIGEPGRGIPTIIEMANHTRLACVTSSAAFMRQAVVQSLAYARQRVAFGRALAEQPLMRVVLADLAIESEAAMVLAMRLATAFEHGDDDPTQRIWKRVITPAAKFWVCKRAVEVVGEAIEVFGGNGYVEPSCMARLYREAPVNSIWEGSGNVMCLDVVRALAREPDALAELLDQLTAMAADDAAVRTEVAALRERAARPAEHLVPDARLLAQRLVLVTQAALLRDAAPPFVADAFIATRLTDPGWGRVVGAYDGRGVDVAALLARSLPA